MIAFFMGTGCRSETILNVRVKDINFENQSILFRHMKTKRQETVPMLIFLRGELLEYIGGGSITYPNARFAMQVLEEFTSEK